MAIRYDKKLNQEIYKTVYEFNKKVKRLSRSDKNVKLPELITTKQLKTKDPTNPMYSYNRADLKRKLKQLQRFLKPGQEAVIVTPAKQVFSKWEYQNLQRQRATSIRRIKKQLKSLEETKATYGGKKMKYSYAQMGSQTYLNLQAKLKYLEEHKLGELEGNTLTYYKKFIAINSKARRDKEWKENFLDIILNLGYEYGENVDDIRNSLMSLNVTQFNKAFNEERLLKDITYYYKFLGESETNIMEGLKDDVSNLIEAIREGLPNIIKNAKE